MHELSYSLSRGHTRINIGKSVKDSLGELPGNSLIVYPESIGNIMEPYLDRGIFHLHIIEDGEAGKSLHSVVKILEHMKSLDFKRTSTLVSIGGGSTSDTVGMAASMYMRGVNYVSIPTTLLSMVDASLGGKNAVNLNGVKNLLGSFYSPAVVNIDTSLVGKMPQLLLTDGMGEIAKYSIAQDRELYQMLSTVNIEELLKNSDSLDSLIMNCVRDKMDLVQKDEFDLLGKRIILNFGHTMGHAIESATDFSIGHGTAVAIGMLLELDLGAQLGFINREMLQTASSLLKKLNLPSSIDKSLISDLSTRMISVVSSDKKATETSIKIPLPVELGMSEVFTVGQKEVNDYIEGFTT